MSRDAPIYIEAFELAVWVAERTAAWDERGRYLAQPVTESAWNLVRHVALALSFPETRLERLAQVDEDIVSLREGLRLARRLALISPGGLRHAVGRLIIIGRMVGGWTKRSKATMGYRP